MEPKYFEPGAFSAFPSSVWLRAGASESSRSCSVAIRLGHLGNPCR